MSVFPRICEGCGGIFDRYEYKTAGGNFSAFCKMCRLKSNHQRTLRELQKETSIANAEYDLESKRIENERERNWAAIKAAQACAGERIEK